METKNPALFATYQTRESVPANQRLFLITPFDPKLPIKHWRDENPPQADDEGLVEYYTLKKVNGAFVWTGDARDANRPAFSRIFVPEKIVELLNIPPKDFTGELQDVLLPTLETPVERTPPTGWRWHYVPMGSPVFAKIGSEPVSLESLNAKLDLILSRLP